MLIYLGRNAYSLIFAPFLCFFSIFGLMRFEIDSEPSEFGFPFITTRTQCVDNSGVMTKNQNVHEVETTNYSNANYLNLFISLLFCFPLGRLIKRIKNSIFRNAIVSYVCINLLILTLAGWNNIESSRKKNPVLSVKETEELNSGQDIPLTRESESSEQFFDDPDVNDEIEISKAIPETLGYFLFPILILLFFPLCLSIISSYCIDMLLLPFNSCNSKILSENEMFDYWIRPLVDSIVFIMVFSIASAFLFYISKFTFNLIMNKFHKIEPYVD